MDTYPDTYSKVALSMTAAQKAKEGLIDELGIGEDIPFNFFGWCEDELLLVIQCSRADMKMTPGPRLEKCTNAMTVMRRYWHCDSITLVAEGFQAKVPELLMGKELQEAFVDKASSVEEVLTATHVEMDRFGHPVATMVSVPYQYLLGRHVIWGDALGYERGIGDIVKNVRIPAVIAECLSESIEPAVVGEDLDRMTGVLMENGFSVQEF